MIDRILRHLMPVPEPAAPSATHEPADSKETERLRRQCEELRDLVLRMERQRDDWKSRFMEQWHQHQNAQALLEQHIQAIGSTFLRTLEILNADRVAAGHPPMTAPGLRRMAAEGERALRSSAEYGEAMRALEATAPRRDDHGQIIGWSKAPSEPDVDAPSALHRVTE